MANFDTAREALDTSLNSSGSAMAEHAKWSESLEASLNKLKAAWQGLSQSFMSSDFLKVVLKSVIALVDGLNKLMDTFGALPTVIGIGLAGKGIFNHFKKDKKTINDVVDAVDRMTDTMSNNNKVTDESVDANKRNAASEIEEAQANTASATTETAEAGANAASATAELAESEANAASTTTEVSEATANAASTASELAEAAANAASATAELAESEANAASTASETAEAAANAASTASELAEAGADVASTAANMGGALTTVAGSITTVGKNASKTAAGGLKSLLGKLGGFVTAHPYITAAVVAVGALTAVYQHQKKKAAELAEEVSNLTDEYKQQKKEINGLKGDYDTSNEDSMISRYEKLSKGVDNLGHNVSLTADEYSEYQSIVNKIADQIPSLVSGYDSQGNAILSVKGNVEELTKAYEDLIHANNRQVLSNVGNITKNWTNTQKQAGGYDFWEDIGNALAFDGLFGGQLDVWDMKDDTAEWLNSLSSDMSKEDIKKELASKHRYEEVIQALQSAGYDVNAWTSGGKIADTLKQILDEDPSKIKNIVKDYYAQFDELIEQQKTAAAAVLSEAFDVSSAISGLDYGNISENLQEVAYQTVNNLSKKKIDSIIEDGGTVEGWTKEMLEQLNSISDEDNAEIESAFNLQTRFNNNEISYGEYIDGLNDVQTTIDGLKLKSRAKYQLEVALGLNDDGVVDQYEALVNRLTDTSWAKTYYLDEFGRETDNILEATTDQNGNYMVSRVERKILKDTEKQFDITEEQARKLLDGLSAEEYAVAIDVITKLSDNNVQETAEQVQSAIEKELASRGLTLDLKIDDVKADLDALATAMSESLSGSGLSSESLTAVENMFKNVNGYDPSKLFERTANGITLNTTELRKLNAEARKTNIDKIDKEMDSLGDAYNQTKEELYSLTYGTKEYNDKAAELSAIEDRIKATEQLAAQYEGLASAYQTWQMAESSGSQRDMYEGIISGFENVDDEISRGWLDDGTIEFLRLIKGENISATATTKELMNAYKSLDDTIKNTTYSVRDFFTVDEDGNSTNAGVYNFLDAIGQLEEEAFGGKDVVKRDKNGNIISFDFQVAGGDKAIADALGISEELVQIMVRAADDAGFVISMDGTYQQLDVLKEKAQEAANKLKDTFGKTNHVFDLNTGNEGTVLKDYNEALKIWEGFKKNKNEDGTVNMNVKGAEEAYTLVSTLQSMVDKLGEPVYMELDASQVEKDMQTPLSKLQQYERLVQQENQLRLKGTDTKEINKAQKEILDYFENLSPEIKAQLGIDDLSRKELQKKLEAGEIEIPATIDLQVEMNNTLRDMVNIALYNAGLLGEGERGKAELEKRVDVSLYAGDIDTSDVKEKVEKEEDNYIWGDYTWEIETDIVAKYANDLELSEMIKDYTPLQQKVIVEYFAEHEEVDEYTPEQKEALVEFIVNSIDPDTYNPDDKDATVTYNRDSSEVDNYDPQNFVRTVTYKIKEVVSKIASGGKKKANQRTGADPAGNDSDVNGTAHANGTAGRAFKQGSWGTKNSGSALGGELGREILVRNGKWFTIGDNGAEFFKYKKGDIIFNHRQTEELLSNGKVTSGDGRAKALVGGTAFADGSKGWGGIGKVIGDIAKDAKEKIKKVAKKVVDNTKKSSKNTSSNNSNSSSRGSKGGGGTDGDGGDGSNGGVGKVDGDAVGSKNEFEETIDFIEIAISRIEREIDNVDRRVNSVYNSWSVRNSELAKEIGKVREEIELQDKAALRYLREANSVGLDKTWAERVRNGTINIYDENDFDEETAEKIKEYQKWYDLYLNCKDAAAELKETEKALYQQRFDHISEEYDGILQSFEHTEAMLNEYISQAEARGHIVSKQYYQALINNEQAKISKLKEEQSALIKARDEAEANGISKNSQAWRDMCAEIDSVTQAIESGTTSIIEYGNAMRDIDWQIFDLMQERISDVATEANFLIELMSFKDLFDDDGKLTSQGLATMGLHGQNVNTYMYQADEYGSEIAKLDAKIASGELDAYDQNVINRRRELVAAQRDCILAAEGEKKAIRDMVEEGINLELEALQELIDKKNEALESERDLYEYQKKVKEQTEEIASLEKQMAAYSGDDSEEARQKIQQIKVELESARENLQETEWDRYIQDTEKILTDLYDEYQLTLNTRLDDTDALFNQIIADINSVAGEGGVIDTALGSEGAIAIALGDNATAIKTTLETEANNVGIKLSDAMNSIWDTGEGNAKSVLTMYGEDFKLKSTTINTTLNNIKIGVDNMVKALDKDAKKDVVDKRTTPAVKKPSLNKAKEVSLEIDERSKSSDGKTKITDETIKGVAAAIWIYGKDSGWGNNPFRENKLSDKLGTANANKVQYYINKYGNNGELYKFWIEHNKDLRKYKYSAFKLGAKNIDETQLAWTQEGKKQEFIVRPSDGAILTPIAKGDSVLTSVASGNIWNMANNPAEFIKDNLKLDAANVPSASGVNNVYTQHIGQVVFDMENVKNYDELISAMKRDKNFENLILSMSIDRIAGKSSLAKGKSIR